MLLQSKLPARLLRFLFILAIPALLASCKGGGEDADADAIPQLKARSGELAKAEEWPKTQQDVKDLTEKIRQDPQDLQSRLKLAMVYMREVRVTGDGAYYYPAIVKVLNSVLDQQPQNFEALVFKSSVAMSQHQFLQGRDLALKAQSINPSNGFVYGVLVDAFVELGNYADAVKMSDSMQAVKPSLEAYARVSYLREIYGDYPGAKAAMRMAVEAGPTGSEGTEWARTTLGDIYLATGHPDTARMLYNSSLEVRKDYAPAMIGLAKVERAEKNYGKAIDYTKQAIRVMSETAYIALLADLYELNGDQAKAAETRKDVIGLLEEARDNEPKNAEIKHNGNRELAQAYLADGQLDKAAEYAAADLKMRPDNIDANELSGWIAYRRGDMATAVACAQKSLATGTKNPEKLYKAGLIYAKAGRAAEGDPLKQQALAANPYLDPKLTAL